MNEELEQLKKDIGEKLYNKLSKEDRDFIIKTEGSIDLGYRANKKDFKRIFKSMERYKSYDL